MNETTHTLLEALQLWRAVDEMDDWITATHMHRDPADIDAAWGKVHAILAKWAPRVRELLDLDPDAGVRGRLLREASVVARDKAIAKAEEKKGGAE